MLLILTSAIVLISLFFATWMLARKLDNYSIVDAAWSFSFILPTLIYCCFSAGWPLRRAAIAILIIAWATRLGIYLTRRIRRHHPEEDRRYKILRKKWPNSFSFLIFFQAQALLTFLLTLPVYLIAANPSTQFHIVEFIGFSLWFVGIIGEAVADFQLQKHRQRNPDSICDSGLWKYSRHPNYFFQSLLWWGLFVVAIASPHGWWSILAPLAMLYSLLRITGIPLTERLSLEKRGEAYRDYQRRTSAFLLLPPKPNSKL